MVHSRPNVLLIHWHDVGAVLGSYGHRGINSPRTDSIAEGGVQFDRAHCTAPLCSPARGSLFTGRADWFTTDPAERSGEDPAGPTTGHAKALRGGSYLCHDSYCNRYRVAARTSNEPDSSAGNTGFRCVTDDLGTAEDARPPDRSALER